MRESHVVALGLGSNLGDRQSNLAAALQRLRDVMRIDRISSVYETVPVGDGTAGQPDFLNLACVGTTELELHDFAQRLRGVACQFDREPRRKHQPRAIDIDVLLYDERVERNGELAVPHPGLVERPFVLVPLAEIAPDLVEPSTRTRVAELAARAGNDGVRKYDAGLIARLRRDVQAAAPSVPLALDRAGVTGIKTLIAPRPDTRVRYGVVTLDVYSDLDARHSGVHMSRFSQDLEDALAELTAAQAASIDDLALALARRVVDSQNAERAEVDARAEIALPRSTPASGLATTEFYAAFAKAVATRSGAKRLIGVEAQGITACPCAQNMVAEHARERLAAEGFGSEQIERLLTMLPIATHNQRSTGSLSIGTDEPLDIAKLVEIVEQSMSSETYDLLKRPDELFVVMRAHFAPRFVEDAVREMLRNALEAFPALPDSAFVSARQVNYESIHKHDAVAEAACTFGELRRELGRDRTVAHTSLERWLAT